MCVYVYIYIYKTYIYKRREIYTHMWVGQRRMHGYTCVYSTFAYPLMQLSNFV